MIHGIFHHLELVSTEIEAKELLEEPDAVNLHVRI